MQAKTRECHWHVTQLTPEASMKHTRRTMNIPDHVRLGWTPYNYLVTYGAVSQWACHTEEEFSRLLNRHNLKLVKWTDWHNGIRSARLEKKEF